MANKNCLEGIACPVCKYEDRFKIAATAWFDVTDDGTECIGDVEWEDINGITCGQCGHHGMVRDFKKSVKKFKGYTRHDRLFIKEDK